MAPRRSGNSVNIKPRGTIHSGMIQVIEDPPSTSTTLKVSFPKTLLVKYIDLIKLLGLSYFFCECLLGTYYLGEILGPRFYKWCLRNQRAKLATLSL